MERTQTALFHLLGLSPFDHRLRRVREAALKTFEKAWTLGANQGVVTADGEEIAALYIHCLARFLTANRIPVPPEVLPPSEEIAKFLKEVLP
jgi:hypothetical protein